MLRPPLLDLIESLQHDIDDAQAKLEAALTIEDYEAGKAAVTAADNYAWATLDEMGPVLSELYVLAGGKLAHDGLTRRIPRRVENDPAWDAADHAVHLQKDGAA